jgi:putative membrane protein
MYEISNDTKKSIKNLISDIESKSDAEIRVVVAHSCDRYRYSIAVFSLLAALLIPFGIKVIGVYITQTNLIALSVATFLFVSFVLEYSDIKYKIIPKKVTKDRCEKMAIAQFYKLGINKTKSHKAILLFVSLKERYVRVVTDENIKQKIDDDFWKSVVKEFVNFVKNGSVDKGLIQIVKKCGEVLEENFPKTTHQKENELSNEMVVLN